MDEQAKIYREIHRQTERRLDAQIAADSSRDQRALVVVAFSVASAGFSIRAAESGASLAFVVAAALFGSAAAIGALVALPRALHGAGYRFETLSGVADGVESYASLVASLAAANDDLIARNERGSVAMINLYRAAILSFALGMAVGLLGIVGVDPDAVQGVNP